MTHKRLGLLPSIVIGVTMSFVLTGSYAREKVPEEILSFHSDIRVNPDSTVLVHETIRMRAEGNQIKHGIYRDFPTHYRDRLGNSYSLTFKVQEALRDGEIEVLRLSFSTLASGPTA